MLSFLLSVVAVTLLAGFLKSPITPSVNLGLSPR
jgi:hypothetical protein